MTFLRAPLIVALASLTLAACGSSSNGGAGGAKGGSGGVSGGGDYVALCKANCQKVVSLCVTDATVAPTALQLCQGACSSGGTTPGTTCSNAPAIAAAAQACSAKATCTELQTCLDAVPECEGGNGGGGSAGTGTGGNTGGLGGASGSGTCLPEFLACCNSAAATVKATCQTYYQMLAAAGATGETACSAALSTAKQTFCP